MPIKNLTTRGHGIIDGRAWELVLENLDSIFFNAIHVAGNFVGKGSKPANRANLIDGLLHEMKVPLFIYDGIVLVCLNLNEQNIYTFFTSDDIDEDFDFEEYIDEVHEDLSETTTDVLIKLVNAGSEYYEEDDLDDDV